MHKFNLIFLMAEGRQLQPLIENTEEHPKGFSFFFGSLFGLLWVAKPISSKPYDCALYRRVLKRDVLCRFGIWVWISDMHPLAGPWMAVVLITKNNRQWENFCAAQTFWMKFIYTVISTLNAICSFCPYALHWAFPEAALGGRIYKHKDIYRFKNMTPQSNIYDLKITTGAWNL